MEDHKNYEGRLSKVEAGLLAQQTKLTEISQILTQISKQNLEATRPQWSNLLGLASILITIMVLAFAPVYTNSDKSEKKIDNHHNEFIDHIKDGHPKVQIEAIKQNDTDIRQNKDAIQKIRDDLKDLRAESIEDRGRFDERIKALEHD